MGRKKKKNESRTSRRNIAEKQEEKGEGGGYTGKEHQRRGREGRRTWELR